MSEVKFWELPCGCWGSLAIRFGEKCCVPLSYLANSNYIFILVGVST